jgi:hypothetical protein
VIQLIKLRSRSPKSLSRKTKSVLSLLEKKRSTTATPERQVRTPALLLKKQLLRRSVTRRKLLDLKRFVRTSVTSLTNVLNPSAST